MMLNTEETIDQKWAGKCLDGDQNALNLFLKTHQSYLQKKVDEFHQKWTDIRLSWQRFGEVLAAIIATRLQSFPAGSLPSAEELLKTLVLDDLFLATACAEGDNQAWQIFKNQYQNFIYEIALRYLKNQHQASELANSLYADLYFSSDDTSSKIASYNGLGSLKGWLRVIIYRKVVDRHRHLSKINEVSLSPAEPKDDDDKLHFEQTLANDVQKEPDQQYFRNKYKNMFQKIVPQAIKQLTSKEKFILDCYYLKNLKEKEIADVYGVHESTASRWLAKARQNMRTTIEKMMYTQFNLTKKDTAEYFMMVLKDLELNLTAAFRKDDQV